VKEGTVVAGTRTIPVIVKEELIRKAEAICKEKPIVTILPMPAKRIHLVVTGSEVFTGRIKDGFAPVVSKKVGELGSELESVKLAPDDPDVIAGHIKDAQRAGADVILVSGGMSVDPDDKTPEGIRRSGAKVETHGFPVLPGSMFVMAYLDANSGHGAFGLRAARSVHGLRRAPAAFACRGKNQPRRHHGDGPWRLAAETRPLKKVKIGKGLFSERDLAKTR
jgi:molybdopterin biosynthesis enzyme